MRQRAAASLLYQSKYAEAAFRNLLKLIFLKIVGRILAFYTVDWAKTKAGRKAGAKAILNVYEFMSENFLASEAYRTLIFNNYDLQWLDFIAQSRKGQEPWISYDYIEGGVANDSVITTVDAYVDGLINAEQAMGKLINERLRNQICILNQEIIEKYLRFVESIELSD